MAHHSRIFITCAILVILSSTALVLGQQIIHFPVNTGFEGQAIQLEMKLEDLNTRVVYVRIFYRTKGAEDYQYVEMEAGTDSYHGEIPAYDVKAPAMEYFLMAVLSNQMIITHPASNPFYAPHEITITRQPQKQAPLPAEALPKPTKTSPKKEIFTEVEGVQILSPEPNTTVSAEDVVIAVSFLKDVKKEAIKLFIDGKNVTRKSKISEYSISYVPSLMLDGDHFIKLVIEDIPSPIEWSFSVAEQKPQTTKKKELPIMGKIFFDAKNEKVSNNKLTTINGGTNFYGRYKSINYRGLIFMTSWEKKDEQPRNRFLLDVGTSWLGIRLGDTNPRFNDLILWGKRVRGIEAYLKLGLFNIEFVQGETNRPISGKLYDMQINPVSGDTLWVHPETGDTINTTDGIYKFGTFKQTLLGIRPSFGSGENFQLGFNILKVKDDVKSIKYGINPKDNIVVGPDILVAFDNHRIELKAGAAFSLYTNDISTGPINKSDIDSTFDTQIPFDPADFENILILNTSTTPLDLTKMTSLAYNMLFKINYFNNTLRFYYKSIGSEYNSLGNSFLRKNIKGFAISDRIGLMKKQLFLTFGYEKYMEGLGYEDDGNPNTAPTDLGSFSIGVAYYPRKPGLPKVSIDFKDHNRNNGLDTLNSIANQTQDISVHFGYDLELLNLNHTISVSIIGSDRIDDLNPNTSNIAADIKMFSLKTKYQIPLTTTVIFATNSNKTGKSINTNSFDYSQVAANATYFLLNQKLKLSGGVNITSAVGKSPINNELKEYTNYKRMAFNIGANYQINPKQYLLFDIYLINFDDKLAKSYSDSIVRLRYELRY